MKKDHAFALSHITYCNRCLLSYFQTKTFLLNPLLQIDAIIVEFGSFLKFGILLLLTLPPNPDLLTFK